MILTAMHLDRLLPESRQEEEKQRIKAAAEGELLYSVFKYEDRKIDAIHTLFHMNKFSFRDDIDGHIIRFYKAAAI